MSFFKAYDMRGEFGRDFNLDMIYRIGRWLPELLGARRMLVGRDARPTSIEIREALCRGLLEAGCIVDDLGLATTPMVYFFTALDGYDASVQITASHNPPTHNGLKVSRAGAIPVGYDTGLRELEELVLSDKPAPPAKGPSHMGTVANLTRFVEWLSAYRTDLSNLRIAIDCSDGVVGGFIRDFLGEEHIYLHDTPDGTFPSHSPNPLDPAAREKLRQVVLEQGLDAGVIFDGDADRVMFLDECGEFVQPDYLIPVLAHPFLAQEPGATVIYDIRTSRGVIEALHTAGAKPLMGKVGHAFAKVLLRESKGICGGELAGHYYFRDFFCCDSGELAAIVILNEIAKARRNGSSFSHLVAPVRKYANSGERNYRVVDKDSATQAVLAAVECYGTPLERVEFDGYRLDYPEWWFNLRPSNTEPFLRLVLEAGDRQMLANRLSVIEQALAPHLESNQIRQ